VIYETIVQELISCDIQLFTNYNFCQPLLFRYRFGGTKLEKALRI